MRLSSIDPIIQKCWELIDEARRTKNTHCIASIQRAIKGLEDAKADLARKLLDETKNKPGTKRVLDPKQGRKDTRLNGNTKYVAKNPGARAGSSDSQIQAMKALLSTLTDPSEKAEVEAAFSKLPEALRAKFAKVLALWISACR